MHLEERLASLGHELPNPPEPKGNYVPTMPVGNLLYISGQLPVKDGGLTHTGAVGDKQTVEAAQAAARQCVLNALAAVKGATGSLEDIEQVVSVTGFVWGVEGFAESPKVLNGASDFLVQLFDEKGKHTRAAVSVNGLPLGATVEVQMIVQIRR